MSHGGRRIAEVLAGRGVRFIFTLCGGHISPILVGCKEVGIRVVDVRHEANAVFAADGVSRLTGVPGVAAVTAGPGVTNALTALRNASEAGSPLVLLGGASATILRGRGSLQDIDQLAAVRSHVKWSTSVQRRDDLAAAVQEAFVQALSGVPGPVFVECPIDLLYDEQTVRSWYLSTARAGKASVKDRALGFVVGRHLDRLFRGGPWTGPPPPRTPAPRDPNPLLLMRAAAMVRKASRPVLLVGSQAVGRAAEAAAVAEAVVQLGVPVWLAGSARGLLGRSHPLQLRHKRRAALKEADLVILAGVPADFRLEYGRSIGAGARVIAVNLDRRLLVKNGVPALPVPADPGRFLRQLARRVGRGTELAPWIGRLRARDTARDQEIVALAERPAPPVNPLRLCRAIEAAMGEQAVIAVDGGDFVATAAYVIRPRGPLSWLDPGVFGTLGVGAGFAIAAALCRPDAETWLVWGDGAAGMSLMEIDTFVRHGLPVIAVIGNDAGWAQIARDQVQLLGDDVATTLARSDYEKVAEAFGALGIALRDEADIEGALGRARAEAAAGRPVLINAHIGRTGFRDGSISV